MKTSPPSRTEDLARRRRRMPALWLALALACIAPPLLSVATAADPEAGPLLELSSFPRSTLTIHSATRNDGHVFRVWLADTPERQSQGLMFVRDLPEDEGMLFVDRDSRIWGMWMKNTFIPLDMVFIDARGRVVAIFERTVPHSEASIWSDGPVRAVLEVNGGTAARLGLKPGDRVLHRMFRNVQ